MWITGNCEHVSDRDQVCAKAARCTVFYNCNLIDAKLRRKHGEQSTTSWKSTCVRSSRFSHVSHCQRTIYCWRSSADTISSSRTPAIPATVTVSTSAGVRNSSIHCTTTSTAASDCATSPIVRRTHRLRVPRLVALRPTVWTHRFHTGQLVYLIFSLFSLLTDWELAFNNSKKRSNLMKGERVKTAR